MAITGIHVGDSEVFVATPIPADVPFPSGTVHTWTASDPSITLRPANSPSTDPGEDAVVASVPADSELKTFELSVSSQMPPDETGAAADPLVDTKSIPVIAVAAPRPTGVAIDQMPRAK